MGYPVRYYIIPGGYKPLEQIINVISYRISHILAPSTFLLNLVRYTRQLSEQELQELSFPDLNSISISGSPCPHVIILSAQKFYERCEADKDFCIRNHWGLTETAGIITSMSYAQFLYRTISLVNSTEAWNAKFVYSKNSGYGLSSEAGEIWVRGPMVMKGYWNHDDFTKGTLTPDGCWRQAM